MLTNRVCYVHWIQGIYYRNSILYLQTNSFTCLDILFQQNIPATPAHISRRAKCLEVGSEWKDSRVWCGSSRTVTIFTWHPSCFNKPILCQWWQLRLIFSQPFYSPWITPVDTSRYDVPVLYIEWQAWKVNQSLQVWFCYFPRLKQSWTVALSGAFSCSSHMVTET